MDNSILISFISAKTIVLQPPMILTQIKKIIFLFFIMNVPFLNNNALEIALQGLAIFKGNDDKIYTYTHLPYTKGGNIKCILM